MSSVQSLHTIAAKLVDTPSTRLDSKTTDAAIQKLASYRLNWYGFILEFCSSLRNRITIGRFQSSAAIICQVASENPSLAQSTLSKAANFMRNGASALEASKEALAAELTNLIGSGAIAQIFTNAPIKTYKKIAAYPATYQVDLTAPSTSKIAGGSLQFPHQFAFSVIKTSNGTLVDISCPYLQFNQWDLHGLFVTKTDVTVHAGPLGLIRKTVLLS